MNLSHPFRCTIIVIYVKWYPPVVTVFFVDDHNIYFLIILVLVWLVGPISLISLFEIEKYH